MYVCMYVCMYECMNKNLLRYFDTDRVANAGHEMKVGMVLNK